jgi:hypothetical protein
MIHVDLEEEVARLRQEKEQLSQELAGALESGRRAGEELGRKDRELSGNTHRLVICRLSPPLFFDMPKITSCLICSAQGERQEAPG